MTADGCLTGKPRIQPEDRTAQALPQGGSPEPEPFAAFNTSSQHRTELKVRVSTMPTRSPLPLEIDV
jgi:hypothetical protein